MLTVLFFVISLSALASWFLLLLLIPFLRCYLLDQPNERSSHILAVPRGGGLSFVLVATFTSFFVWFFGLGTTSVSFIFFRGSIVIFLLAVVGLIDDRYSLPASFRYCIQFLTASCLVFLSPLPLNWLVIFLSVFFVTAIINFANFMDGLDGLVASCMLVAISALAIKFSAPLPIWSLVGALFGFLYWNWSPAKVFMGDVGSTFLGAIYAYLVFQASTWWDALCMFLVLTPLFADACLCVIRRLLAGQSVFKPHRLHLYQRLHQAGFSHSSVCLIYILATFTLALAMFFGGLSWVIIFSAFEIFLGILLDQFVAVPFLLASRN